ncbi:MAG: T9SS type A sorting domain-containing protein [Taibaiella sp.]|nr:T9SS type A sorting domain-containing protein [Taibaiella sp.]
MKHFSLSRSVGKSFNCGKALALLLILLAGSISSFATISVTPSLGGTNICAAKAIGGSDPAFTTIGPIIIQEGAATDFNGALSITFSPPTGWQFDVSSTLTLASVGSGLSVSGGFVGGDIVITGTLSGTHATSTNWIIIDAITIQATSTGAAPGNITNTAMSGTWNGLSMGTNFGSLSLTPEPGAVSVSGGGTFCTANTTLTASGGAGGTIYYQGTTSGGTSTGTASSSEVVNTSGTYYFRAQTVAGCWGQQGSAAVTFNTPPTVASITPSTTNLCLGTSLTLTAGAVTGTGGLVSYNWTGPDGFSTTTSTNFVTFTPTTTAASGSYSLSVTYPGTGCTSSSVSSSAVTVNTLPTVASITPSSTEICTGSTLTLTSGAVTGTGSLTSYNWSGPNGYTATTAVDNAAVSLTTTAQSGVYTLSVTYPGTGCTSNPVTSSSVTVNNRPTVASITPSNAINCIGATLTFTAGSVTGTGSLTSYNWTGPNAFSTTTATNTTSFTTSSTAESGAYSLTVTYPGTGCTSTFAVTSPAVTVNAVPTVASITPSSTNICTGNSLTLTAGSVTGGGTLTSYNWSGPNGYSTTSVANNVAFTPTTTAASGDYSLTVTYPGAGCTSSMVVTSPSVTVNQSPAAITGTTIFCDGATSTLSNAVGGGTWASSNTGVATVGSLSGVVTGVTPGTSVITYELTGPCIAVTTVTVLPLPTITSSTGNEACAGGTTTVSATPSSGAKVNWYDAASAGTQLGTGNILTVTAPTVTTTYYAEAVDITGDSVASPFSGGNGNAGIMFDVTALNTVDINSFTPLAFAGTYDYEIYYRTGTFVGHEASATGWTLIGTLAGSSSGSNGPRTIPLSSPLTVTAGQTYAIYVTSTTGSGVQYTNNASVGAVVGSNSDLQIKVGYGKAYPFGGSNVGRAPNMQINYSTPGCVSATRTGVVLTVNATPTVASITPSPTSLCAGATLTLTAGAVTGTGTLLSYNWSGPDTYSSTSASNTTTLNPASSAGSGEYSVSVTYTGAGCTSTQAVSSTVTVDPLPTAVTVSGGGTYCTANATLTTSGGTGGTIYFQGTTSGGTSTATPATSQIVSTSGTYYFRSLSAGGCWGPEGSATVTFNAQPTVASITPSPTNLCLGTNLTLTAGSVTGTGGLVSYNWTGPNSFSTTTAGNSVVFTPTTTAASGVYTLSVTYPGTGCTSTDVVSTTVSVNAVPTVSSITPSASTVCTNSTLTLFAGSVTGAGTLTSYNWSGPNGFSTTTTAVSTAFTPTTTASSGDYSLTVTYPGVGCTSSEVTTSVTVNVQPTVSSITADASELCEGATITFTGAGASGTGSLTSYNWSGPNAYSATTSGSTTSISSLTTSASGVYSLTVTYPGAGCTSNPVTTSPAVTVNDLPTVASITPSTTTACVGLPLTFTAGSTTGTGSLTSYNWSGPNAYSATTTVGSASFSPTTTAYSGVYSLTVTYPGVGCTSNPVTTAYVSVVPRPDIYNVTGGGVICAGDAGVHIGLDWSLYGINYQLYNSSGTAIGSPMGGSTSGLDFGLINTAGTYTVLATNASTGCQSDMAGSATVTVNPLPTAYAVTGGGTTCENSMAVSVGLANSDAGITYQLYNGSSTTGSPVAGTGAAISFGAQNVSGTYSVRATNNTTSCVGGMTGSVVVSINPAPTAYALTGGGNYCSGGAGLAVGLANSNTGIDYQLYNGASAVGSAVSGTGSAISFGTFTAAGTYTVLATNTSTSCTGPMSGNATIVINPLPTAYTVTGGGAYCAGGAGVAVGLSFSATGINYQLYNGGSAAGSPVAGTGSAISFGNQTLAGTYTVMATDATTSCTNPMTGSVDVIMNALPVAQTVTGGGAFCTGGSGVPVGLGNSETGISYQLYNGASTVGSPIGGTGSAISFGNQATAGTYTVVGTNTVTTCTNAMSGSASVTVNPLPTQYVVTGGGDYCAGGSGVAIGLNSSNTGISYQLYNGASVSGSPIDGTGSAVSFGSRTAAGTYSAVATNTVTGCVGNMFGSVAVVIDPLPTQYTVTGGGHYCAGGTGVVIGLGMTNAGINYQLYNGASPAGSPVAGTGAAISFGSHTASGTYTVLATNSTTLCTEAMSNSVTVVIDPLPNVQTVTGGGTYCQYGAGVPVGLASSQTGINYQLYNGATAVGSQVAGTGSAISFGNQTLAATYSVLATDASTGCTNAMSGTATVIMNPAPIAYAVTGGGAYCAGGAGVAVGVANSETGISYQLYNGATAVGSPVAGTGSAISFGNQTLAATYSVLATNTVTACTNAMTGNAVVIMNPLPNAYAITGGGAYCSGGSGVAVGLYSSQSGINYQLYRGSTTVGSPVAGTGTAISFGNQTTAGTYSILATNATTGCTKSMTGSVGVVVNALPVVQAVTGGGNACSGGAGAHIGLASSEVGINYQAFIGSTAVTAAIGGTGDELDLGQQWAPGSYTIIGVNATTGCTSTMAGSATVVLNYPPTAYSVTGGGTYCSGGSGVAVGLANSASTASYRLYLGTTAVGSPVTGTGSAISFGSYTTAGTYTVLATNIANACFAPMTGSATVGINPLPTAYNVTGGGNYCPGTSGATITLDGSNTGIEYRMYLGTSVVGAPITGTGSALNMGIYSTTGTYSVQATNILTGCVNGMTGSVSVSPYTPPAVYTVTGGGAYCTGSTPPSISITSSQAGVNYGLYLGSSLVSTMAGTGYTLNFGPQATPGTYSVLATNATTSCTSAMTGTVSVSVNSLPLTYNVGGGGSYCAGGAGVAVTLSGSATGVNYQLMNGATATGAALAGTGSALNFGPMTAAGTYTVRATNATTGCVNNMTGSAIVIINPLPVAYDVSGGGAYCSGSTGVSVGLSGSESGITYTLYRGGTTVGSPVSGGGAAFSFGVYTTAGTYTVQAVNSGTGCSNPMNGGATVSVNPLPSTYTITGGGNYCNGGTGVSVGLSWSDAGVNYQLYNGSTATGSPVAGLNGPLDFGMMTGAGTYSVRATNASTSCVNNMTGTVSVGINPLPGAFSVTGGGTYCLGSTGVEVGLSGSEAGINYSLYNGSTLTGSAVAGTGAAISFGPNAAGTYTVLAVDATTSCQTAMTGSATVNANVQPAPFTVSGGGSHCSGTTGPAVTLSSSQTGVSYKLYNGTTYTGIMLAGSGSSLNFGTQDAAGTYTVLATNNSTGCTRGMTGSATVIVNAAPTAFAVTGGGNYCAGGAGVPVGISGSQSGVLYRLYKGTATVGSPVAGTGSAISFGNQTANGVYSVSAMNSSTSCSTGMTGTVTVNANALPTAYSMLGGGAYCAGGSGVNVSLGSSNAGVTYQLYNGSTPVGSPTAGTGFILHFGFQTAAGTYSVVATDNISGCTNAMNGTAPVVVNPLPTSHDVTGGGAYCEGGTGVAVGISGTEAGNSYTLYRGSTIAASSVPGTGGSLSFGLMTAAGTYTVLATNTTTGCTAAMGSNAIVTVNARPLEFDITGGGGYCAGGTGVHLGVSNSQTGVSYQLYNGSSMVGGALAGTGDMLDFGAQTTAGTYSVLATNSTTGCARAMAGTAPVVVNALPSLYSVVGGGNYCAGGSGVNVGLGGSDFGITYRLYKDGVLTGSPVSGTGFEISFGMQTGLGAYTIVAENAGNACTATMLGAATVGNSAPPVVYNLSAGGSYCSGGTGVELSLDGSESGVDYRLYNGSTATGIIVGGTGSEIDFGSVPAGSYSVLAVNSTTSCSSDMNGTATVSINTLPTAFAVTGGGAYCAGSSVTVGLSGSQSNVSYQLYNGTTAIGSALTGTGSALNFGTVAEGVYSVRATNSITGCVGGMTGSVTAVMNAQPNAYTVTGGGTLCSGAAGVTVALSGSQTGVNYSLYNGATAVGTAIAGTGLALTFPAQTTAGDYTVMAVNATTSCSRSMTGSANVVVNPTPATFTVTGGGSYCPGTSGVHIGLSGSGAGISYQLYRGSVMAGAATAGTGGTVDFGSFTDAGTYMVVATNATTACTANMDGTATVAVNPQPAVQALVASSTGYCAGSAGVEFTLANTQTGTSYSLYNGTTLVGGPIAGTGSGISFGFKMPTGMYSAVATDALNGCTTNMTGTPSIVMNTLPDIFAVSGGGAYCGGTSGSTVSLLSSQSGINYQLYRNGSMSGSVVAGTGSAITFGPQTAGTYTVQAINAGTGCRSNMSGSASVIMNAAPAVFTVTGGGQYCAGSTGVHVGLSGSATGIKYTLYNGTTAVGLPVNGTGSPIDFGTMTAGSYMVVANNPITACTSNMSGTATVIMNAVPEVHLVSGGGSVCAGGTGVAIMIDGSETGINYRAYNGSSAVGTAVAGTGSGLTLGSFNAAGTYTVRATDASTSCTSAMTGTATINVNALPAIQTVTGGGNYCEGGSGAVIGLGGSAEGVNYKLYQGASLVSTTAGTGFAFSFAPATAVGTYTVMAVNATTGCSRAMLGDATVATTPTVAPTVTLNSASGDTLCAGVPAAFSTAITNGGTTPAYTWKVNGVTMSSTAATFSYLPANGDVVAVTLASSATCATPATVTASRTFTVIESQMPSVTAEITGGDTICDGSPVTITAVPTFGGSAPSFSWVKNGVPSASGASFTFTPVNGDVVYVRMTSNYQCRLASLVSGNNDTMSVIVALAPTVGIVSDKGLSVNKGEALTLTATAVNTYKPTYQWYLNGALIHGATLSTFTYASYEDKDTVSCRVANNTPCGEYASVNTVMINVSSVGVANVGNAAFDVRVTPNPTRGNFIIKGSIESAGSDEVTYEVTDMLGQTVHVGKAQLKNGIIDQAVTLSNSLANGMYMVSLHASGTTKVFHIVLQQ